MELSILCGVDIFLHIAISISPKDNVFFFSSRDCKSMLQNAFNDCKVLNFTSYSEEWLDFILNCRSGKDTSNYDIVMGGVANDKVFNTVELFFDGLIDKKEALKRLKYEKPNMQIAFRNQTVIDKYLSFERSFNL